MKEVCVEIRHAIDQGRAIAAVLRAKAETANPKWAAAMLKAAELHEAGAERKAKRLKSS